MALEWDKFISGDEVVTVCEKMCYFDTPFTNSIMRIISALFGRKIETGPE